MTYTVIIKRSARKQIEKIPTSYIKKIKTAILNLADDPRPHGCVKLTGSKIFTEYGKAFTGSFMK